MSMKHSRRSESVVGSAAAIWGLLHLLSISPGYAQVDDTLGFAMSPVTAEQWSILAEGETYEAVKRRLEEAGWPSDEISARISRDRAYDIFERGVAPGTSAYMLVPDEREAGLIEFSPYEHLFASGSGVHPAFFSGMSRENIRDEVIRGIEAAIEALCTMRVRPNMIRASASAFGIVQVEGTWTSAEVCN
jgi:hypothetical protein